MMISWIDGERNILLIVTNQEYIFKIICGCSGSGDMKVMQFKVETGQKVLDLKVILFLYEKQIFKAV